MTSPGTDVQHAAEVLRDGGLVAFPTETVYGLGADALNETAVAKVFVVKNRPHFDPLIVHVHDVAQLNVLVQDVPATARQLIERFWPGPLSLVLPKTAAVPDLVTAGLPTVAVRMPDHPLALDLLRTADMPVAAPSANPFGAVSPTTAAHVAEQLGDAVDYILDGGPCRVGVESTVLHVGGPERGNSPVADAPGSPVAVLLRPGGVTVEELEGLTGPVRLPADAQDPESESPPSPGMLRRHYAPATPLEIQHTVREPDAGERVGLLTMQPHRLAERFASVEVLSASGDVVEAASRFFAALRRLDAAELDRIVAVPFSEEGLGRALNDRLRRAADR